MAGDILHTVPKDKTPPDLAAAIADAARRSRSYVARRDSLIAKAIIEHGASLREVAGLSGLSQSACRYIAYPRPKKSQAGLDAPGT